MNSRPLVFTVYWLFFAGVVGANALSAEPLGIKGRTFSHDAGRYLEILRESDQPPRPADLFRAERGRFAFEKNRKKHLALGYTPHVWWLRLPLKNENSRNRTAMIMLETNTLDQVDLYYRDENGKIIHLRGGDRMALEKWTTVQELPLLFPVQVPGKKERSVLLRLESDSFLSFPVRVMDSATAFTRVSRRNALEGGYVGFLLLAFVLLLFLFRETRDVLVVWYILYSVFYFLVFFVDVGHAFVWLWPDWPAWQNRSEFIFMSIASFCALSFAARFLHLKTESPLALRTFQLFQMMFVVYGILVLAGVRPRILVSVFAIPFFLMGPLILLTSLLIREGRGFRSTAYFFVAWFITFIFATLNILVKIHVLPMHWFFNYGAPLAFPIELVLLAASLYRRKLDELSEIGREIARQNAELIERLHLVSERPHYRRSQIMNINIGESVERLIALFEVERIYRVEDLRAAYVAREMNMTFHQFSEFLNRVLKTSFYQLINEYRIREAKQLLTRDPEARVLDIAFNVGFQSKSAFNKAFKSVAGITPSEYRKSLNG